MGEIIIYEKDKANLLLAKGYNYRKRTIGDKDVYVFVQTPKLVEYLSSNFDANSFAVSKTLKF